MVLCSGVESVALELSNPKYTSHEVVVFESINLDSMIFHAVFYVRVSKPAFESSPSQASESLVKGSQAALPSATTLLRLMICEIEACHVVPSG